MLKGKNPKKSKIDKFSVSKDRKNVQKSQKSSATIENKSKQDKKSVNNPKNKNSLNISEKNKKKDKPIIIKTNGKKTLNTKDINNIKDIPKKQGVRKSIVKATSKIDEIAKTRTKTTNAGKKATNLVVENKRKKVSAIKNIKTGAKFNSKADKLNLKINMKSKSEDKRKNLNSDKNLKEKSKENKNLAASLNQNSTQNQEEHISSKTSLDTKSRSRNKNLSSREEKKVEKSIDKGNNEEKNTIFLENSNLATRLRTNSKEIRELANISTISEKSQSKTITEIKDDKNEAENLKSATKSQPNNVQKNEENSKKIESVKEKSLVKSQKVNRNARLLARMKDINDNSEVKENLQAKEIQNTSQNTTKATNVPKPKVLNKRISKLETSKIRGQKTVSKPKKLVPKKASKSNKSQLKQTENKIVQSTSIMDEETKQNPDISIEKSISIEVDDQNSNEETIINNNNLNLQNISEEPIQRSKLKKNIKKPRSRSRTLERKVENITNSADNKNNKRGRPTKNAKIKDYDTTDLLKELEKKDQKPVIIQQTVEFPKELMELAKLMKEKLIKEKMTPKHVVQVSTKAEPKNDSVSLAILRGLQSVGTKGFFKKIIDWASMNYREEVVNLIRNEFGMRPKKSTANREIKRDEMMTFDKEELQRFHPVLEGRVGGYDEDENENEIEDEIQDGEEEFNNKLESKINQQKEMQERAYDQRLTEQRVQDLQSNDSNSKIHEENLENLKEDSANENMSHSEQEGEEEKSQTEEEKENNEDEDTSEKEQTPSKDEENIIEQNERDNGQSEQSEKQENKQNVDNQLNKSQEKLNKNTQDLGSSIYTTKDLEPLNISKEDRYFFSANNYLSYLGEEDKIK